ncbi:MAG: fumarylacetoacetate hydrolase family protein, partial [Firmicutes bacterium]|nr:fumarylacetoacetate hydrolase family protein [Bacillota bacterium]
DCEGLWPVRDCFGIEADSMLDVVCCGEKQVKLAAFEKRPQGEAPLTLSDVTLCAPVPNPVGDVMCLGVNYYAHLVESNKAGHVSMEQKGHTVYFSKRVNEAVPHGGTIPSHREICDRLDYEVELGVVIGRDARNVKREDALDYVFGYTIINDISARNIQEEHKQWYFGKSLDGSCPMGPCIVTAAEFGNPKGHAICSVINGELRQNSNTELMMKDVPGLIEELSSGITLKAGTVIATGTPAGVAMGMEHPKWLQPGDTVECRIEGIGSLVNTIGE